MNCSRLSDVVTALYLQGLRVCFEAGWNGLKILLNLFHFEITLLYNQIDKWLICYSVSFIFNIQGSWSRCLPHYRHDRPCDHIPILRKIEWHNRLKECAAAVLMTINYITIIPVKIISNCRFCQNRLWYWGRETTVNMNEIFYTLFILKLVHFMHYLY